MKQTKYILISLILLIICLCLYLYIKVEYFNNPMQYNTITKTAMPTIAMPTTAMPTTAMPTNTAIFFDNTDLLTTANYANNKYISVPNDESLTNFYKLDIDSNYNIAPFITIPSTTIPNTTMFNL